MTTLRDLNLPFRERHVLVDLLPSEVDPYRPQARGDWTDFYNFSAEKACELITYDTLICSYGCGKITAKNIVDAFAEHGLKIRDCPPSRVKKNTSACGMVVNALGLDT